MAGLPGSGRVDHHVHAGLPDHGGAKFGGDRLLEHGHDPGVHVDHLGVAAPNAALPHVTLAAGHEAGHLQSRVRGAHLSHHLLKAVEFRSLCVNIMLVNLEFNLKFIYVEDSLVKIFYYIFISIWISFCILNVFSYLISKNKELLLSSKFDNRFNILPGLDLASRVAGVDNNNRLDLALVLGCVVGPLQLSDVQGPAPGLVQVVAHLVHVVLGQAGAVQGILRDGDHHAGLLGRAGVHQ